MADLELLNKAQDYIEKLANGINPLNGEKITDESVLNNIEIIRCLFHANYVLKQVIDNDGEIGRKKQHTKTAFVYDEELIKQVYISPIPIVLSQIVTNIRSVFKNMRLYYKDVAPILYNKGILIDNPTGNPKFMASPEAADFGIWSEIKKGHRGEYQKTLFDEDGQRYVLECLKGMGSEKEKQQ